MERHGAHCQLREALFEARRKRGFTQSQVAALLNKPQSFVSKYERGERRLDVVEFLEVCKALKANPAAILRRLETDDD